MLSRIFIFLILICTSFSCQETERKTPKPLNPNGDSELALLMRELQTNTSIIKNEIEKVNFDSSEKSNNEYFAKLIESRHKLTEAEPSDKNLKSTNTYSNFVKMYNYSVSNFLDNNIKTNNYNNMINNCISCHQQFCLGTIATINKLKIK